MDLQNYHHDAATCVRCSNCKWVDQIYTQSALFSQICPINSKYGFDAYSGGGMLTIARELLDKKLEFNRRLLDIIYKCTLCGACDVRCKRNLDIEVLLTIEALRKEAVETGWGPLDSHKGIANKITETRNRYGIENGKRMDWFSGEQPSKQQPEILYFVGCNSSFFQKELASCTEKILNAAHISFAMLREEWCCGHPLLVTGQEENAYELITHNIEAIKETGITTVLTSCAECYHTLKVKYPKVLHKKTEDMEFKVVHLAEYANQLLKDGRLNIKNSFDAKVTYHDPCHLGRLSEPWKPWDGTFGKFGIPVPPREMRRGTFGVYEEPRNILRSISGVKVLEMERRRDQAWCCGAGGEVRSAAKDFALWAAKERIEEACSTGAQAIISSCPYCEENLKEAIKKNSRKIEVYDIAQVLARVL